MKSADEWKTREKRGEKGRKEREKEKERLSKNEGFFAVEGEMPLRAASTNRLQSGASLIGLVFRRREQQLRKDSDSDACHRLSGAGAQDENGQVIMSAACNRGVPSFKNAIMSKCKAESYPFFFIALPHAPRLAVFKATPTKDCTGFL